ncbi:cilia- and flagella-associated protein 119 isoform X2 [Patella vulgata]|uniref:cilia- and flagella-associated protein 119 isoform X2 n=1 Tax=Patella vulgata TaxID=6465 RepID=UPI00217F7AE4|nr:cilia- and flagella-associated protein 119 isoform X2 [Patella vulgata]
MILITDPGVETKQPIPHLIQPREHKAKISVWADLTVDDIDKLNESLNADHNKHVLADLFELEDYKENLKSGITVDLYYYTIQFARENNFTKEKTSTLFSIIKKTHEVCIETPFGNLEQTFKYFKDLLLCHAVKRPPHSIDLFDADEVRKISEYTINTYFRHFKMYKYAFTPLVRLDLSMNYVGVPDSPPPSEAGDLEGEPDGDACGDETKVEGDDGEGPKENASSEQPEVIESPARKELRTMIQTFLAEEIKKMKISVDEQIKTTEEVIQHKIEAVDGGVTKKSPRASAKGKRKEKN